MSVGTTKACKWRQLHGCHGQARTLCVMSWSPSNCHSWLHGADSSIRSHLSPSKKRSPMVSRRHWHSLVNYRRLACRPCKHLRKHNHHTQVPNAKLRHVIGRPTCLDTTGLGWKKSVPQWSRSLTLIDLGCVGAAQRVTDINQIITLPFLQRIQCLGVPRVHNLSSLLFCNYR